MTHRLRLFHLIFAILVVSVPGALPLHAQQEKKQLTLEDFTASGKLFGSFFRGGEWDRWGPVIRSIERGPEGGTNLVSYNLETGKKDVLLAGAELIAPDVDRPIRIEDYKYSDDGTKVLLYTESAAVWRHNTKGYYYVYDQMTGKVTPLSDRELGYQMFAKISPDGFFAVFVRDRNLFGVELKTMQELQLTSDGAAGSIINGTTDWVYEEEFGLKDGWEWSPDSKMIAFLQLDESPIKEFHMLDSRGKDPKLFTMKFPKAGEDNSYIRIGVFDFRTHETRFFETETWKDRQEGSEYIPRFGWTPDFSGIHYVWYMRMNRDQNNMELFYGNPESMETMSMLMEMDESWVDVESSPHGSEKLTYLEDGQHFVMLNEMDGYKHLHLFVNEGAPLRQLTSGEWEVTDFHGVDEEKGLVYFTATAESPLERHLYVVRMDGEGEMRRITVKPGTHSIDMSRDFSYYMDTYSSASMPPVTTLHTIDGKQIGVLEGNEKLIATLASYDLPTTEFMTLPGADGTLLHAYMIKPSNFDETKSYPLLIHTYGGPGNQSVSDSWGGFFWYWYAYLAQQHGIIVACVDNRGSSYRGKRFAAALYRNMGTVEPQDQLAAAKYWGALPYIDKDRIGIWGWSYGGYNSLMTMLKYDGPEIIKLALAIAPGVDWELYDTIYTERYMSTPQMNAAGYEEGKVANFVANMSDRQKLMVVHGDMDDNAHYQNTVQLVSALQKANKQFRMMVYPGGNHSMRGTGNRFVFAHLFGLMTDFVVSEL